MGKIFTFGAYVFIVGFLAGLFFKTGLDLMSRGGLLEVVGGLGFLVLSFGLALKVDDLLSLLGVKNERLPDPQAKLKEAVESV